MIKVIKLVSDNYDDLVTMDVYNDIKLQMSTGDFHTHEATVVEVEDYSNVICELEEDLE